MKTRLRYKLAPLTDYPEVAVMKIDDMDESLRDTGLIGEFEGIWVRSDGRLALGNGTIYLRGRDRDSDSDVDFLRFPSAAECTAWCDKANRAIQHAVKAHFGAKEEPETKDGWLEVVA